MVKKKVMITLGDGVSQELHTVVGQDLEVGYQQMAHDETREVEALAWVEAMLADIADEMCSGLGDQLRVVPWLRGAQGLPSRRRARRLELP